MQYSTRKKKAKDLKLRTLEKKLYDLEKKQAADINLFQDKAEQSMLIKKDIEDIRLQKTEGAILRSKSNWLQYGEKMSEYFFALEKTKGRRKAIQRIENDKGQLKKTNTEILEVLHNFTRISLNGILPKLTRTS